MRKIIFAGLFLPLLMMSCMSADDIEFRGVEDIEMKSATRPTLVLNVANRSKRNIDLSEGYVTLYKGGKAVAEVTLDDDVTLPKKFDGSLRVPLKVKVKDPLLMLSASLGGSVLTPDMTVTAGVKARSGAFRKKFEYEDMPVSRFLSKFGVRQKDIDKLMR